MQRREHVELGIGQTEFAQFRADGLITAVGTGLPSPPGTEVIDATGCIVRPGFVDTHRHTWQAAIRSIAPDISVTGYLERVLGDLTPRYRAEDAYAGNLSSWQAA